ncbi:hypothetical protein DEI92_04845 [Curtobacterium sp. MCBD17_034]|uniref:hypothetical protein n=1 Tax=unclassified Curtobacterium TaxID=257496 RepID=UPI000DA94158|nr:MULTISPECIES: hypothetical protein [unclassified Curtobacterium]PZF60956.1 hypothetical protein DEI92_04845 [Curtobacterium sp. MCBD17_034]PZM40306.1 hypothetical protein DEI90_01080 [Curtobacterium sp. MCBD17_031]
MPIRERLHDQLDLVVVLGPVREDVIDALPDALHRHLISDDGSELRRAYRPDRAWGHVSRRTADSLADDVLDVAVDGLEPAEMATHLLDAGYAVLPIRMLVSGGLIAVLVPHDLFDGASSGHHIRRVLAIAAGEPEGRTVRPPTRRPLAATMRVAGLDRPGPLRLARAARRDAERQVPPDPQVPGGLAVDRARRLRGFRTVQLDEQELRTLDARAVDGAGRRTTRGMKLSAAVLDAIADAVPPTTDFTIRMNVDLRRWAPRGERVQGPFSTSYPIGRLRTMRRDAASVHEQVRRAIETRAPLAALVGDVVGLVRDRVRHPFPIPSGDVIRTQFDVALSVFPSLIPDAVWRPGATPLLGTILVHPGHVANPYVQMSLVGSEASIALWDETGIIDQDRFEQSLRAAVTPAARVREEHHA